MNKRINRMLCIMLAMVVSCSMIIVNAAEAVTLPAGVISQNENGKAVEIDEEQVKTLLQNYFDAYYLDFSETEDGKLLEFAIDNIIPNESTNLFLAFHEWENKSVDLAENWYEDSTVTLDFIDITINDSKVQTSLNMTLKYKYTLSEDYSYIVQVPYRFSLIMKNNVLKIDSIETDSDDFKGFYQDYMKEVNRSSNARNSEQKKENALEKVKEDYISNTEAFAAQVKNLISEQSEEELDTPTIVPFTAASYTASDATRYAERLVYADASRFFYKVNGNNCTNFVSQCLWAGYGGYATDFSVMADRMNRRYQMTSEWYAGSGGGSPAWENVTNLWDYLMKSKSTGPTATGLNNGAVYTKLFVGSSPQRAIKPGNVLQFRVGSTGNYGHSVIVYTVPSSPSDTDTELNQIKIAQNTDDIIGRSLWEVINRKGGSNCNMRLIRPSNFK